MKQHRLLPERRTDIFKDAMEKQNAETADADNQKYNTHIVEKVVFFPAELALIKKQFSDRGSVFSIDRLRNLLVSGTSASGIKEGSFSRSTGVAGSPSSVNTSVATTASGYSQVPSDLFDIVSKAFIGRHPAAPEMDSLSLPKIRNTRAASVAPSAGADTSLTGGKGAIKKGGGVASTSRASTVNGPSLPPSPTSSGAPRSSFSVDTALFMATRELAGSDPSSPLMAPIAVYEALVLLTRIPAFVAAKLKMVEELALAAMQRHEYSRLPELQQRVNDISAHLAALQTKGSATPGGFVELKGCKALWGAVQVRTRERDEPTIDGNKAATGASAAATAQPVTAPVPPTTIRKKASH